MMKYEENYQDDNLQFFDIVTYVVVIFLLLVTVA